MNSSKARICRFEPDAGKRILVMSDIHGNLPYFTSLLEKLNFGGGDELIINGDFTEKGSRSLETLRCIMKLSRAGNVHTICGNCDGWSNIFYSSEEHDRRVLRYIRYRKSGLIWDMFASLGIDPLELTDLSPYKDMLWQNFRAEWDFLIRLPHALETSRFVFAHAGMDPNKPLCEHTADELSRRDRFMDEGSSFDKWLIVGHYPVVLYGEDIVCANPVIDRERRIISIDGGCVLKDDGQLNALIIPDRDSEDFSFTHYDRFPIHSVLSDQAQGERSYYIRWGDSTVRVLRRGGEFSRCRHVRTGYEMDILTKYLFTADEITGCNDCTDYVLPLRRGDTVSVVETCSRGYFVKHNGVSGWYYGELK